MQTQRTTNLTLSHLIVSQFNLRSSERKESFQTLKMKTIYFVVSLIAIFMLHVSVQAKANDDDSSSSLSTGERGSSAGGRGGTGSVAKGIGWFSKTGFHSKSSRMTSSSGFVRPPPPGFQGKQFGYTKVPPRSSYINNNNFYNPHSGHRGFLINALSYGAGKSHDIKHLTQNFDQDSSEEQAWDEEDDKNWRATTKSPYFENKIPGENVTLPAAAVIGENLEKEKPEILNQHLFIYFQALQQLSDWCHFYR